MTTALDDTQSFAHVKPRTNGASDKAATKTAGKSAAKHVDARKLESERMRKAYGGRALKAGGITALVFIIVINILILAFGLLAATRDSGESTSMPTEGLQEFGLAPDSGTPGEPGTAPDAALPGETAESAPGDTGGEGAAGDGQAGGEATSLVPAAGTYTATASGSESLSPVGVSHTHGPDTTVEIIHNGNDCWTARIPLNAEHTSESEYCVRDGQLVKTGGRDVQSWNLLIMTSENTNTATCDPAIPYLIPGASPGQTWGGECTSSNSDASVPGKMLQKSTMTYVGVEMVPVGSEKVRAHHIQDVQTYSPATSDNTQKGGGSRDLWFAESNGLPIREVRTTETQSGSPVGTITYRDNQVWNLTTTQPG